MAIPSAPAPDPAPPTYAVPEAKSKSRDVRVAQEHKRLRDSTAEQLLDALYSGKQRVFREHLIALDAEERPLAVHALRDVVEDSSISRRLREMAAAGLGWLGDPSAIDSLLTAFLRDEARIQTQSAAALAHIGGPIAVQSLLDGIVEGSPSQQYAAATALASAGGKPARDALTEAIRNHPEVRATACANVAGDLGILIACFGSD